MMERGVVLFAPFIFLLAEKGRKCFNSFKYKESKPVAPVAHQDRAQDS